MLLKENPPFSCKLDENRPGVAQISLSTVNKAVSGQTVPVPVGVAVAVKNLPTVFVPPQVV